MDPRELGRPLDERERREFERIVAGFGGPSDEGEPWSIPERRPAGGPAPVPPAPPVVLAPGAPLGPPPAATPAPAGRAGALTTRQVLFVLAASAVFAALTATLPSPLNLWAPVVVLCVLAAACVVWGCRAERRRR